MQDRLLWNKASCTSRIYQDYRSRTTSSLYWLPTKCRVVQQLAVISTSTANLSSGLAFCYRVSYCRNSFYRPEAWFPSTSDYQQSPVWPQARPLRAPWGPSRTGSCQWAGVRSAHEPLLRLTRLGIGVCLLFAAGTLQLRVLWISCAVSVRGPAQIRTNLTATAFTSLFP